MGDSQHTQNIHINKVIGENEKCVFYFMKKLNELFDDPIIEMLLLRMSPIRFHPIGSWQSVREKNM